MYNLCMPWIRIFKTLYQAEKARDILKEGGIKSYVTEDTYQGVPIDNYKVPARYRLSVGTTEEYFKAAEYLGKMMKKKK